MNRPGLNQTDSLENRLRSRLVRTSGVRIAVAYVSRSGTTKLLDAGLPPSRSKLIVGLGFARTDPIAVEDLVEAGAEVRLFLGNAGQPPEAFHPKLYMLDLGKTLVVFSGSANLTEAGLSTNVEQFEELRVRDAARTAHLRRFGRIWRTGFSFADVEASGAWDTYKKRHRALADARAQVDRRGRSATAKMAARVLATREWHELKPREGIAAERLGSLDGRKVAVSGRLPDGLVRAKFETELKSSGATITQTITRGYTDVLIVGKGAGSKLRHAREARVARMTYHEARKLLAR